MARQILTDKFWVEHQGQPTTPMQALMEARPGEDVQVSSIEEDSETLKDLVGALLPEMSEVERDILIMSINGLSIRDIADNVGISKSEIWRKLPGLKEQLAEAFNDNEEIQQRVLHARADSEDGA